MTQSEKVSKEAELLDSLRQAKTHTVSVDYAMRFCSEFVDYVAGRGGAYLAGELEDEGDSDLKELSIFPKRKRLPPLQMADLTDTYRQATRLLSSYFAAECNKMSMAEVTLDTVSQHFRKNVTIDQLLGDPILVHVLVDAGECVGAGVVKDFGVMGGFDD